jgi:translation initiation factor 1 (eIF-1/SUI1)
MTTLELSNLPKISADARGFITKCSKKFCVGGSYDKDENVIKFSGDVRDGLAELLVSEKHVDKNNIKIHGY